MTSHWKSCSAVLIAALLFVAPIAPASADEAPAPAPKPAPVAVPNPAHAETPDAPPLSVKVDAKATETRIRISRQALAQLQGTALPAAKKDTGFIHSPERTVGAGIALTLALVLAGLYLARRNSRTAMRPAVLIAALALFGVTFAGTIAFADKAPAPKPAPSTALLHPNGQTATVKDSDSAELTVSAGALRLLQKKYGISNP